MFTGLRFTIFNIHIPMATRLSETHNSQLSPRQLNGSNLTSEFVAQDQDR